MVHRDEIRSKYISHLHPRLKSSLFEIRTDFNLRSKSADEEGIIVLKTIASERYDARVFEDRDGSYLYKLIGGRLLEYWMTRDEVQAFVDKAIAFAKQMADKPVFAALDPIPVVANLDVSTVKQEGESVDAFMERAITPKNLVPLYLFPSVTNVGVRPLSFWRLVLAGSIRRTRVKSIEEGMALMRSCHLCSRETKVGVQISSLGCKHAFHSHCLIRWFGKSDSCPSCEYVALNPNFEIVPPPPAPAVSVTDQA